MSLPLRECGLKGLIKISVQPLFAVTPLAGVWIESSRSGRSGCMVSVTSLAGVWIESVRHCFKVYCTVVTSLAGVWIESVKALNCRARTCVTSLAGVWIESVGPAASGSPAAGSLPLRECGLKVLHPFQEFYQLRRHSPCGSVD